MAVKINQILNTEPCKVRWSDKDRLFVTSVKYVDWFNENGSKFKKDLIVDIDIDQSSSFRSTFEPAEETQFCIKQNVTGISWLPITPWIAFHRLFHAWQFSTPENQKEFTSEYSSHLLESIIIHLYPLSSNRQSIAKFLTSCMTTRSANCGHILIPDIVSELFAQWCRFGTVKVTGDLEPFTHKINSYFEEVWTEIKDKKITW